MAENIADTRMYSLHVNIYFQRKIIMIDEITKIQVDEKTGIVTIPNNYKMVSGFAEQAKRIYRVAPVRENSIRRTEPGGLWFYPANERNPADNVFFGNPNWGKPGHRRSNGFGGSILEFTLDDFSTIKIAGPWHGNADSMFVDTGLDLRDKHLTWGIVAKTKLESGWNQPLLYKDVLHLDTEPVVGTFDRIEDLAKKFVKELGCVVYYHRESCGGSHTGSEP